MRCNYAINKYPEAFTSIDPSLTFAGRILLQQRESEQRRAYLVTRMQKIAVHFNGRLGSVNRLFDMMVGYTVISVLLRNRKR